MKLQFPSLLALSLSLCGCQDRSDDPIQACEEGMESCDCAVARAISDPEDNLPDCTQQLVWSSACRDEPPELSQDGLLYAGTVSSTIEGTWEAPTFTITDAETWDAFIAGWYEAPELPAVDFATHAVVAVHDGINSTCSAGVGEHGVWVPTQPYYSAVVYAEFRDSTGSCLTHCAMEVDLWVFYALRREDMYPVICANQRNLCN